MNTPAVTYITRLPVETSKIRDLQLSVDYWSMMHAEAGLEASRAWKLYDEAIESKAPREEIEDLLGKALTFEFICHDTYKAHEEAKKQLLDL